MNLKTCLVCAAGVIAIAAPASAFASPADEMRSDVQCLAVAAAAASSSDPKTAAAAPAAALYFLGRIDGRDPNFDIETALIAEAKAMSTDDLRAAGQRCGALLEGRGHALEKIGEDVKQDAAAGS